MNLDFKDYEAVRKQLFIKVSPVGKILHEQKDAPYEKRENLAITAHVLLKQNEDYVASMAVTNPMLESFGVTKEQLFHDASANAPSIFPARITDMDKVMTELCLDLILEEDKADMTKEEIQQILSDLGTIDMRDTKMIVVTNERKLDGAAAIFYPGVMEQIGKQMEGNYYILPSSIHETIVVPDDGTANCKELEEMVNEVNLKQVAPEERLANKVYHYDAENKIFELAESFEKRMRNQKLSRGDHNRPENRENKKHKGPSF